MSYFKRVLSAVCATSEIHTPTPADQCGLDRMVNVVLRDKTDTTFINEQFQLLSMFNKALSTIPEGKKFTVKTGNNETIQLQKKNGLFSKVV
jgi:hypothetical protein